MTDKVCVVVGAGPGLGLALAKRFGTAGYKVGLVARRVEALEGYAQQLKGEGVTALGFPADISDSTALESAFSQIKAELGTVEVLIYNAAVMKQGTPSTLSVDSFLADFRVNVVGALVSSQQVIPDMKAKGAGTILFTGGGLALNPYPPYASLAIGKAGVRSLAYSLGGELQPDGIYVGTVTIAGIVQPGTFFDPDKIAEKYWEMHTQRQEREFIFKQG